MVSVCGKKTHALSAFIIVGFLSLLLLLSGCGSQSTAQSARQKRIANHELIVAIGEEPENGFDATSYGHGTLTRLLFSTLYERDSDFSWKGDLATDYSVSDNHLVWTVTIRDDARFTDGSKVTADDVAFTFNTAKHAASEVDLTMLEEAVALDEHTVEFKLSRPYSPFMERMAYLGIVPEHAYSEAFKDAPISSGPFKLVQWDKGQQMIFAVNENYYGVKPKLTKLTIVLLEKDAATAALEKGVIDVAQIDGNLAKKQIAGTQVIDIESIECYGVCFPYPLNEGKFSPEGNAIGNDVTSDVAIRKALNIALDRERIVETILGGYGSSSTTGLENMPWQNSEMALTPSEYPDVQGAEALLEKAGWVDSNSDGIREKGELKAEFTLLYTPGVYRQEFALEFQKVASQIGIKVELEQTTWDEIAPKIHSNAVLYGFGSGAPSELYSLYYGGDLGKGVLWNNSGYYHNPAVDAEIDKALASRNEEEALPHWMALQEYASPRGDAPYAWFANANHVYLAAESFTFGAPLIQSHGGRIFDNVIEWAWEN